MHKQERKHARNIILVGGLLVFWFACSFPYVRYFYEPGVYPRGQVLIETSRVERQHVIPAGWEWLVGTVEGTYFEAWGFVPFWNIIDKDVQWPVMAGIAAGILAFASSLMWFFREPRGTILPLDRAAALPDPEETPAHPRALTPRGT